MGDGMNFVKPAMCVYATRPEYAQTILRLLIGDPDESIRGLAKSINKPVSFITDILDAVFIQGDQSPITMEGKLEQYENRTTSCNEG